jgi:DNA-binding IclR family transcriptional regulator
MGLRQVQRPELQALERGLGVLDIFLRRDTEEIFVADVGEELGLPRSTGYRFLRALREQGYLEPGSRRGSFRLGSKVALLARHARPSLQLAEAARPLLARLVVETRETAFVTVRAGQAALCVARAESPQPVRLAYEEGRLMPLHAGCSAKVLLAYGPREVQEAVLSGELRAFTAATTCDPTAIRAQLARVRAAGYAISQGETDPGAAAICVPAFTADGELVAAVTVAGPAFRLGEAELAGFLPAARGVAAALAAAPAKDTTASRSRTAATQASDQRAAGR